MMRPQPAMAKRAAVCVSVIAAAWALAVPVARADVHLAVLPADLQVERGEVFDVELTITEAGTPFNAYDALVGYDSACLTFLQLPDAEQEGPLMTDVCGQTWQNFEVQGEILSISHVLLCAQQNVTGPGVVYRLRFQANELDARTYIRLLPGGTAFYDAGSEIGPVWTADAAVTIGAGVGVPDPLDQAGFRLIAAPNPFNPQTVISFETSSAGPVRLEILGVDGRRIRSLLAGILAAGHHQANWDGRDAAGRPVGSGVYRMRLEAGGRSAMRSVTLLK